MKLIIGIIVLFVPLFARAAMTGNELLNACEKVDAPASAELSDTDRWNTMQCMGYINGVTDANNIWWNSAKVDLPFGPSYCIASGVKKDQVFRIIAKYLRDHPERLHLTAAQLINDALAVAFPCH